MTAAAINLINAWCSRLTSYVVVVVVQLTLKRLLKQYQLTQSCCTAHLRQGHLALDGEECINREELHLLRRGQEIIFCFFEHLPNIDFQVSNKLLGQRSVTANLQVLNIHFLHTGLLSCVDSENHPISLELVGTARTNALKRFNANISK